MSDPNKILLVGESGAGKTCALASLLDAGYNVRVIDTDNGLSALRNILSDSKSKYSGEAMKRLAYVTITEPMRLVDGRIFAAKATVWPRTTSVLSHWRNDDALAGTVCDLGPVSSWTDKDVLVIDTLSTLSQGALNFHLAMNGALGAVRTQNEVRRDIGGAQQFIRALLQMLYDASVRCHVIINSHVVYVRQDGTGDLTPGENALTQGFPATIGRALSPEIPRYFNAVLMGKAVGSGLATRRKIYTVTQGNVNLKNVAPLRINAEYDQETGLADYFKAVNGVAK